MLRDWKGIYINYTNTQHLHLLSPVLLLSTLLLPEVSESKCSHQGKEQVSGLEVGESPILQRGGCSQMAAKSTTAAPWVVLHNSHPVFSSSVQHSASISLHSLLCGTMKFPCSQSLDGKGLFWRPKMKDLMGLGERRTNMGTRCFFFLVENPSSLTPNFYFHSPQEQRQYRKYRVRQAINPTLA